MTAEVTSHDSFKLTQWSRKSDSIEVASKMSGLRCHRGLDSIELALHRTREERQLRVGRAMSRKMPDVAVDHQRQTDSRSATRFRRSPGRKQIEFGQRQWAERLESEYGYGRRQIDVGVPVREHGRIVGVADVLGYRDNDRKRPVVMVQVGGATLMDSKEDELGKASTLARALHAEYYAWASGDELDVFEVGRGEGDDYPARGIPSWYVGRRLSHFVAKSRVLPPFRDEGELRAVVKGCHDLIFVNMGHDHAKAFDEFMKILLCKLFDERADHGEYRFAWLSKEAESTVAQRVRELYGEALAHDAFDTALSAEEFQKDHHHIGIDDLTIAEIVDRLQHRSLVGSADAVRGTDVKGVVFESMVGSTFRGNLGAYFTPRKVADFMVRMIAPQAHETVLDPACGSGGFLLMTLRYHKDAIRSADPEISEAQLAQKVRELSSQKLFGCDINERMVRVAITNMVMHSALAKIRQRNGLELTAQEMLGPDSQGFDIILANPPFAGFERSEDLLRGFEAAQRPDGSVQALHKTIPFVEKIVDLLAPGGRAGLVLPISVLNAEEASFVRLREFLFEHTRILAIVGLPRAAFYHTDCGVEGALLFVQKCDRPSENYKVFMGWADEVGYDRLGKESRRNDLPVILRAYRGADWPADCTFGSREIREAGRIDPAWWHPSNTEMRRRLEVSSASGDLVPLGAYVRVREEKISPRSIKPDETYRYFEVRDANMDSGTVRTTHEVTGDVIMSKNRIRMRVHEGDILLPNHRDSLNAKSATGMGRSVVVVGPHLEGYLTTDRFLVLEPLVDPWFLRALLNSGHVRRQLVMHARGGASLDIRKTVLNRVLVPALDDQSLDLMAEIRRRGQRLEHMRSEVETEETGLRECIERFFEGRIKSQSAQ